MSKKNHQNNDVPEPHIYLTKEEIQELNNELERLGINFYVKPANECIFHHVSPKKEKKVKPKNNTKNKNLSPKNFISKKRLSPSTDCESNINSENKLKKNGKNESNKCSLLSMKRYIAKLDKNIKNKSIQNDLNQKMIIIKDIMELCLNFSEENLKNFCVNHKLNTIGRQIKEDDLKSKTYNQLLRIKEDVKIDLEVCKINSVKNGRSIRQEMEMEKRNYEKLQKKIEKKRQKQEIQNNDDIELDEENYFRNNVENISNINHDNDNEDSDKSEASFDESLG